MLYALPVKLRRLQRNALQRFDWVNVELSESLDVLPLVNSSLKYSPV